MKEDENEVEDVRPKSDQRKPGQKLWKTTVRLDK